MYGHESIVSIFFVFAIHLMLTRNSHKNLFTAPIECQECKILWNYYGASVILYINY
jgi:hypothetical protein